MVDYSFGCKIDAKGRILIPSGLKKKLMPVMDKGFIIKRSVFEPCLELYPKEEWEKELTQINKLNRFIKKNMDFIRRFMAGVAPIEVDSNGRIQIPKQLAELAGLNREVVLSGVISRIEIWDKERYEQKLKETDEDFQSLAEEVMGGIEKTETEE